SVMVLVYTQRGPTAVALAVIISALMFVGIQARMVSSSALMSAIPAPANRGAYMAVSSCVQYIAGGFATWLAGQIVSVGPTGELEHFAVVGYVIIGATVITCVMMWLLQKTLPDPALRVAPTSSEPVRPAARETA
ncbi:MAG: MFS transporter, partial [Clostridia bacterium]|nr:MFS transporter [Deltaproteobacteria bacterium]